MSVAAAACNSAVDRFGKPSLIVGMNRGDNLRERNSLASQRGIQVESARKPIVDRELVARDIPMPGSYDGACFKSELHALNILSSYCFADPETLFCLTARGNVVEYDGNLLVFGIADPHCTSNQRLNASA